MDIQLSRMAAAAPSIPATVNDAVLPGQGQADR